MPARYAREMVARGFVASTLDFRGCGQSGDLPAGFRSVQDSVAKTSGIEATVSYVATLPETDPTQIYGLGICGSASDMIDAVPFNSEVSGIGLVAPWLQNQEIMAAVYVVTKASPL